MSSRWISISASAPGRASLIAACAALTRALLPVPRAPHNRTLLAGSPAANRSVFSRRMSRTRSIPRNSSIGTRLTLATGSSHSRSACQTKASAASRSLTGARAGARRSSASAMRWSNGTRSESVIGGGRYHTEEKHENRRSVRGLPFCEASRTNAGAPRLPPGSAPRLLALTAATYHFEVDADAYLAGLCARDGHDGPERADPVPAACPDFRRVLLPVDPAAAAEAEGAPRDDRRAAARRQDRDRRRRPRHSVEGGGPGGGRGRHRLRRACAGVAQHDRQRPRQARPRR